ncbi:hypothetical protein SAMN04487866_101115 [Thermoactinomyces sp. DSM 45891]|uniref:HAD family hydrolase n=1 Tax=Thermoactinomyces sp. DSM 45891 TaxID=1761907 RepID=UPI00091A4CF5|nr:HAD family hydrolase [Thermoactinomyces sp. DSM 45891]SFW99528.1 hypothetical protein SAMN04487866_101115 [Thermoactinomyces sp. DSM 45891]
MSNKHLIVLDLDGTLLTEDKKISQATKQVLHQAMSEGHEVAIATGRPYRMSMQYYQELGLRSPIVNYNGALSHHPHDTSFEKHHITIPLEQAHHIIETCYSLDMPNILVEIEDHIYSSTTGSENTNHKFFSLHAHEIHTGDLLQLIKDHPTSILAQFHDHHNWDEIQKTFIDRHSHIVHHRKWDEPFQVVEVLRQGVDKAVGVERMARYYDIPKERIIAFGDEDNDMEMLQYVGKGVAMGNAIEALKNVADDITDRNDHDGVANYLKKYLKLQS